jgi:predicted nucleotidyltransferase component of viral defense system
VDITIREEIVFPLESRRVLRAYEEHADLPEDAEILTYSLREIAAEKVVALLDPARNEPRDLYDLWFFACHGHVDLGRLSSALISHTEIFSTSSKEPSRRLDRFGSRRAR